MVFVHVFVHGTKEIINILVISLIQSELHSLIIRESLVQAQVGPPPKNQALTFICGCFSFCGSELIRNFDFRFLLSTSSWGSADFLGQSEIPVHLLKQMESSVKNSGV